MCMYFKTIVNFATYTKKKLFVNYANQLDFLPKNIIIIKLDKTMNVITKLKTHRSKCKLKKRSLLVTSNCMHV